MGLCDAKDYAIKHKGGVLRGLQTGTATEHAREVSSGYGPVASVQTALSR
jgi:hypothetical protein